MDAVSWFLHNYSTFYLLAGSARLPLFSVILSQCIYLYMNVCPQIFVAAKRRAIAWRIPYDQIARVHNTDHSVILTELCGCR